MLDWTLKSVYDVYDQHVSLYRHFLFKLLKERTDMPNVNISHDIMPTYEEHIKFVMSEPYYGWWIIVNHDEPNDCIGMLYVTKAAELGIQIISAHQYKGYAKAVLKSFIDMNKDLALLANINPKNEKSKKLFESLGFKIIQETYKLNVREPKVKFPSD